MGGTHSGEGKVDGTGGGIAGLKPLGWPEGWESSAKGSVGMKNTEDRISAGDGFGLRVGDERRRNFSSECIYFSQ